MLVKYQLEQEKGKYDMNKKRIDLFSGLSTQEAEDLLHYCLGPEGQVIIGHHFREELKNEDLEIQDAWFVLRCGHIFQSPESDVRTGEWKYSVEGHETDGKYVVIVFSFKTIEEAFLITVFSIESKRRAP